jgi:hypothetical protein
MDVFGRFDAALTFILDEAYQRADQKYRNKTKVAAGIIAVILALIGGKHHYQCCGLAGIPVWQGWAGGIHLRSHCCSARTDRQRSYFSASGRR